jgi:hypothetical protein
MSLDVLVPQLSVASLEIGPAHLASVADMLARARKVKGD